MKSPLDGRALRVAFLTPVLALTLALALGLPGCGGSPEVVHHDDPIVRRRCIDCEETTDQRWLRGDEITPYDVYFCEDCDSRQIVAWR